MSVEPCELHEVSNCGVCSGVDKKFQDSVARKHDFSDGVPWETYDDGPLPIIPGATVIRSQFGGSCAGCGRRYEARDVIFQQRGSSDGWQSASCCA